MLMFFIRNCQKIRMVIYKYIYIYINIKYYERKKGRNYISRQACFVNRFTLQGFNIYIYIYIFFFTYSYLELATLVTNSNSVAWTLQHEHSGVFHRNRIQLLTLSTLASVCIFSILFPIHSLRC